MNYRNNYFFTWLLLVILLPVYGVSFDTPLSLAITTNKTYRPCIGLVIIDPTATLISLGNYISDNLSNNLDPSVGFTSITLHTHENFNTSDLKALENKNISLIVILKQIAPTCCEFGIFNIAQKKEVFKKRIRYGAPLEDVANAMSDILWNKLTGNPGIFTTKIAYCTDVITNNELHKTLMITSAHKIDRKALMAHGKPLALRWHPNSDYPLILFSEITDANICLRSIDLQGQINTIANFEGITMLPSFSSDGKTMVYCRSEKDSTSIYKYNQSTSCLKKVIHQPHVHILSPILLDNDDIIYCKYAKGTAGIYYYTASSDHSTLLTPHGYCTCPTYNAVQHKLAYCKEIKGHTQLFSYALSTQHHEQLTIDPTNKEDCCWSPCGNYLTFVEKNAGQARIAVFNACTHQRYYLSSTNQRCSYPSWSSAL